MKNIEKFREIMENIYSKKRIDWKIRKQIRWLNKNDFPTIFSCSGHKDKPLYITFQNLSTYHLNLLKNFSPLGKEDDNRYTIRFYGEKKILKLNKLIFSLRM